jgi:trigger factor
VKTSVETLSPTKVRLTMEVPAAEFAPILAAAYRQANNELTVPGFRKGKVPARIIDQRLGRDTVVDFALERGLDRWYSAGVEEHKLVPLAMPETDVVSRPGPEGSQTPIVVTAEVEIRPNVDLPDLSSLTVSVPAIEVSEERIDQRLEALREQFATLVTVDRPAGDGDFVSIDLGASVGGEEIDAVSGISYEIGSETMVDGLDEALTGLSAGETTSFEAPLQGGEHAGAEGLITVTVRSVKERELPEVDDDWAGEASEFDTVAELREGLREQLGKDLQMGQAIQAREAVMEALIDAVEMPIPQGVLADMLAHHLEGQDSPTPEDTEEAKKRLEREIASDLISDLLAAQFQIEVTRDDLAVHLVQMAQRVGVDPSTYAEYVQERGLMQGHVAEIARAKALDAALAQVPLVDDAGQPVDPSALLHQFAAYGESDDEVDDAEDVDDDDEGDEDDGAAD